MSFTMQDIANSIPEECDFDLDHVQVHIDLARSANQRSDLDQYLHNMDLAGRILLAMVHQVNQFKIAEENLDPRDNQHV